MKQEKKISLDVLYKELRDYCFEVLVDDTISWRGYYGLYSGRLSMSSCDYGYGPCTAPDTLCPHWQGTFCELDIYYTKLEKEREYEHESEL